MTFNRRRFGGADTGHRSGFEASVGEQLGEPQAGPMYENKAAVVEYRDPVVHKYKPDFFLPNGIRIEVKGRFTALDRRKHLLIKQQHPQLDIRFIFQRSKAFLSKGSKTTYAMWCLKNGFLFADKLVPESWLRERK